MRLFSHVILSTPKPEPGKIVLTARAALFYTALLASTFFFAACTDEAALAPLTLNFLGEGDGTVTLSTSDAGDASYRQDVTELFRVGQSVELTATADDGSVFVGWDGDCSGADAPVCEVLMDADKAVRAVFAKEFTLRLEFEGTGSGQTLVTAADGRETPCRATCEVVFNAGTVVTLTASPDPNATFTSWGQACTATAPTCRLTVDAPKTVTATFDRVSATRFDLVVTKAGAGTVTGSPPGINCGTDCRETYPKNTVVTLSAAPDASSTFVGWSGACSGAGSCAVAMSASKTVTATFEKKQVRLEVSLTGTGAGSVTSPAGVNCPATCTASFDYGTNITLTAAPAAGSTFAGWSGSCTGTSCTLTLTGATNVTASFVKDVNPTTYTLSVLKAGSGNGTVSSTPSGIDCGSACSADFATDTTVTLRTTANSGSVFAAWQNCPDASGDVCRVALSTATQVTAVFEPEASARVRTVRVPIRGTDPNNARVSTDDAEQFLKKPANNSLPANATDTTGGDLDLAYDTLNRTQQLVGLRFRDLNIPQGATIESAYIQFKSDEDYAHTTFPKLTIKAEANPNAPTFVEGAVNNISDRPVTVAQVTWLPQLWGDENTADAANEEERSPDLSALVQEVVDNPAWNASSALVFILSGEPDSTAHRAATSHEDTDGPAQLFVTYRY